MIEPPKLDELKFPAELRRAYNKLRDYVLSMRIADGVGYRVNRLATGQELRFSASAISGVDSSCKIRRLYVSGIQDHYLECIQISDDSQGASGTPFNVLRPLSLWPTDSRSAPSGTTSESLEEATGQSRTLSIERTLDSETKTFEVVQTIIPAYTTGLPVSNTDTIYAATCDGLITGVDDSGGNPIRWIDLNVDARRWEIDLVATLTCVNNELKYILVPRTEVEEDQ